MTASEVVNPDGGSHSGGPRFSQLRSAAPVILPSLLLCDFGHLADEIGRLEQAGVKALHLDVMDGHFVPNLTYGPLIAEGVRKCTDLPVEAHLMISKPLDYVRQFHDAGCDHLTFHIEAAADPRPILEAIHESGCTAGLAFNPPTPVSAIEPFIDGCDSILVMSVMPGFGGQKFDSTALGKLRQLRDRPGHRPLLGIDGGIHESTIATATAAGAELFAVGSAIFYPGSDYGQALTELTRLAREGLAHEGSQH
ncbi:MAG TPA: ribulose-phosphate 3-epimerase [Pirellulales bacterium]